MGVTEHVPPVGQAGTSGHQEAAANQIGRIPILMEILSGGKRQTGDTHTS